MPQLTIVRDVQKRWHQLIQGPTGVQAARHQLLETGRRRVTAVRRARSPARIMPCVPVNIGCRRGIRKEIDTHIGEISPLRRADLLLLRLSRVVRRVRLLKKAFGARTRCRIRCSRGGLLPRGLGATDGVGRRLRCLLLHAPLLRRAAGHVEGGAAVVDVRRGVRWLAAHRLVLHVR